MAADVSSTGKPESRPRPVPKAGHPRIEEMTADQIGWVIQRTCTSVLRYDDRRSARSAAWRVRNMTLRPQRAYLCPFSESEESPHWHVGHVPSIDVLHRLAEATRPGPSDVGPRHAA